MSQRDYFEKDYYAVLGVDKSADAVAINKAYRKLARELHPDARPGDASAESRFKEVSEAHAVLSNPEKRKEYDEVRSLIGARGGFRGFGDGGAPGAGFPGGAAGGSFDISDLLGGLFGQAGQAGPPGGFGSAGGRRRSQSARRGRDVETELTLGFEDAMAGVTTTLRVLGNAACSNCGGSGAAPGTSPTSCHTCRGSGVVSDNQGMFSLSEPCPTCHGTGREIATPCTACRGSGTELRTREIRARIPAGVKDGARVRLAGKGEAGAFGAPPGDLFVLVHVQPHRLFGRSGNNLTLHVPITFAEAALGADIAVPTLTEPVTLRIPAGTESGKRLRVKGHGVPRPGGQAGDLVVTVDVVVPRKLTRTQRRLVEQLADTDDRSIRAHLDQQAV